MKGGYNDHPTVTQARSALRLTACYGLLKDSRTKSCKSGEMEFLLPPIPMNQILHVTLPDVDPIGEELSSDQNTIHSDSHSAQTSAFSFFPPYISCMSNSLHEDAYLYVLGYHLQKNISCKTCIEALQQAPGENVFIKHKLFNENCNLINPIKMLGSEAEQLKLHVFLFLKDRGYVNDLHQNILKDPSVLNLFKCDFVHMECRSKVQSIILVALTKFFIKLFCKRKNEEILCLKNQISHKKLKNLTRNFNHSFPIYYIFYLRLCTYYV